MRSIIPRGITVADGSPTEFQASIGQPFSVLDRQVLGGFNQSSQHPILGGVDDKNRQTEILAFNTGQIELARKAISLAT
jgi:hypothetical protein